MLRRGKSGNGFAVVQIISECNNIVLLVALQWIMQDNGLNKIHSCFQWSNQNMSGKFACSGVGFFFSFFREKMNNLWVPSTIPSSLSDYTVTGQYRTWGAVGQGIQPRWWAGSRRPGIFWEGKGREAISCTARERELLTGRYECLGFKEYCLSCLNIAAGVRWMCWGKLLLYVKIGEKGTWPFEY